MESLRKIKSEILMGVARVLYMAQTNTDNFTALDFELIDKSIVAKFNREPMFRVQAEIIAAISIKYLVDLHRDNERMRRVLQ